MLIIYDDKIPYNKSIFRIIVIETFIRKYFYAFCLEM